jgi:hypothetical protein
MTQASEKRTRSRTASHRRRGQVGGGWSPSIVSSRYDQDEHQFWREREIDIIARALADRGELRRRELGEIIGCKYWGPGRFRGALKDALEQGRIERVGFGRYAPAGRR